MDEETINTLQSQNLYQHNSFMSFRLDTSPLFEDLKHFMEGQFIHPYVDNHGIEKVKLIKTGEAKANMQGRQAILSLIRSIINPQIVQGNFDEKMYYKFCDLFHTKISIMIMNNRYTWGIKSADYPLLITCIITIVRPYLSRLIKNGERQSYANTMRMLETLRQEPLEKSKWGFGGGKE